MYEIARCNEKYNGMGYEKWIDPWGESHNTCRDGESLAVNVRLSFVNDALRALCNTRARLRAEFGEAADEIELRLWALANADKLEDITIRPPDRRRLEKKLGARVGSVCARTAGRIYFEADSQDDSEAALGKATAIQIISIGWRH